MIRLLPYLAVLEVLICAFLVWSSWRLRTRKPRLEPVPCHRCRYLTYGLIKDFPTYPRCTKGLTSDMCSDFSCFKAKP
jgi:hypothetical protein